MNKEILMVVDAVSNEKGVEKEVIFQAMEAALASATRKRHGEDIEVRVSINRETGEYETFRRWMVFADDSTELEEPARELRLEDALDLDPKAVPGEFVEEPMESVEFGRIAAQTAKQVIVQKVREAEREQVVEEYQGRVGELLSGIVKRVDRNGAYVDLGANAEGFIPRESLIPREPIKPQDRIKSMLAEVRAELRGPQLFLTRTSPQFLIELFKIEVPEVGQGLIDILVLDLGDRPFEFDLGEIRQLDGRNDLEGHLVFKIRLAIDHRLDFALQIDLGLQRRTQFAFLKRLLAGLADGFLDDFRHDLTAERLAQMGDGNLARPESLEADLRL